jgi:hypothetical protein
MELNQSGTVVKTYIYAGIRDNHLFAKGRSVIIMNRLRRKIVWCVVLISPVAVIAYVFWPVFPFGDTLCNAADAVGDWFAP